MSTCRVRPLPDGTGTHVDEAKVLERVEGIEPSYSAWKAAALPLSYTRIHDPPAVVEGVGFEPT